MNWNRGVDEEIDGQINGYFKSMLLESSRMEWNLDKNMNEYEYE